MKFIRKASVSLLFVMGLLGLFVLFSFFPVRLDFSKGAAYTLSPSTKKIIRANNKTIEINLYVSSDLPTRILPLKTDVVELLQEYRRGGKNIKLTIVDPKKDPKTTEKAKTFGIPELQFSQLERNKYQTSTFYFGIAITQGDKNEIIPQVSDFQNLEYSITSALYRLTRETVPKVGVVGEANPSSSLKKILSQQYDVVDVDLSSNPKLSDYSVLILIDNATNIFSNEQIKLLKEYYESGKNILVFAGGVKIDDRSLNVSQADHNLNELTATYGAQIESNLVLSTTAEYVNFGNEMSQFLAPYPFWIRSNLFNTKSGLFTNIQFVTLPWISSLTLSERKGFISTPLIISSKTSWVQKDSFILNPNSIPQPTQKDLKQFTLGVLIKNIKGGEMIVIPSSRFPSEQYVSRGGGNSDFILNAVDALSASGVLTGIRSRIVSFYPITDISDSQKDFYKYTAILLFPLIWGIYGAIRLMKRK